MRINLFDRATLKATITDEGYLVDSPIVGRTGIQIYRDGKGNVKRYYRPPEEVFNVDSLSSFIGKPITDDHPDSGYVNAKNAKNLSIGSITSIGRQDGNNVISDIAIHHHEAIDKAVNGGKKELSLGYHTDIDETPGTIDGQSYDGIQRNIRINHLALVARGRAGNAKINLDGDGVLVADVDDVFNDDEEGDMPGNDEIKLGRIKLDTGIEYQASPEVVVAFDKITKDNAELQAKLDAATAKCDALKVEVDKIPQIKLDAEAKALETVKFRSTLETQAKAFKVDATGMTDRQVKEAVIKSVDAKAVLTDKSDAYVDAAFDFHVSNTNTADLGIQKQRQAVADGIDTDQSKVVKLATYQDHMANLGKKEEAK